MPATCEKPKMLTKPPGICDEWLKRATEECESKSWWEKQYAKDFDAGKLQPDEITDADDFKKNAKNFRLKYRKCILMSTYTAGGRLASQYLTLPQLNREYGYDDGGHLIRIREAQQSWAYRYSDNGRLTAVRTTSTDLDMTIPYATDPAGNRLPDPELSPESTLTRWPDNRIGEDAQYVYRYDRHGRLTEKTDRIPEGVNRMYDERTHRYSYDNQHRLVHYIRTQYHQTQAEGRYLYDAQGRRVGKQVWKREREHSAYEQMALSRRPSVTWYGWEGDRLATVQTAQSRIQTVYSPGSFTPLVRIETANAAREKARHRSLVAVLQQEGSEDGQGVVFPAELVRMLDRLEDEIRQNAVSEESRAWLAGCGLTVEQMAAQMEEAPEPQRKIHLYHCDHRGLPLALVDTDNKVAWQGKIIRSMFFAQIKPHFLLKNHTIYCS